ncbi:unnamed protein product [Soboliphyme baturini]|uniref:AAA domain-containing protein n=1 Tax=Soboliphyme baturini TaxID=241478 RepID=A0A183J076_9BILA|nr:unnamed protein product [Soboliphyme baturini]
MDLKPLTPSRKTPARKTPLKERNEIVSCSSCGIRLTKNDQSKHSVVCSSETPFVAETAIFDFVLSNGFVDGNGTLYATLKLVDLPPELQGLDQWTMDHLVFMNVLSMQTLGIVLEEAVVMSCGPQREKHIAIMWPHEQLPSLVVGIPRNGLYAALVKTEKCVLLETVPLTIASEVCVRILNESYCVDQPSFANYLHSCLCNVIFSSPSTEAVYVYGQRFAVRLTAIEQRSGVDTIPPLLSNLKISTESISDKGSYSSSEEEPQKFSKSSSTAMSYFKITKSTTVKVHRKALPTTNFDDIGGLQRAKERLIHHVIYPMQLLRAKQISGREVHTRNILLYGTSGCGKTLLAKALSVEANLPLICLQVGELESKLRIDDLLPRSSDITCPAPCLVLLDEIDSFLSGKRLQKEGLEALCKLMDGASEAEQPWFFIATSNKPEKLHCEIRRRFDLEIDVAVPTAFDRASVLKIILKDFAHQLSDTDIVQVADLTHGYTPSDLKILCKEAVSASYARQYETKNHCRLSLSDMFMSMNNVRPSAMREIFIDIPKVRWDEIGGMQELKLKLRQTVEWPLKHADRFAKLGITPPKGVLMYGPPGCSKTMIAKALATESGLNFISIKGPELFSKWVGESERAVRDVFRRARQVAPSIIFFDEIDAIASERSSSQESGRVSDRVLAQLLTEMDGIQSLDLVTVVAATNRPDKIDPALLRPGRLDRLIYVPLPDAETRREILRLRCAHMPIAPDVTMDWLVSVTDQYSGAEIVAFCNEAALIAMGENLDACEVAQRHFKKSYSLVIPRACHSQICEYELFGMR